MSITFPKPNLLKPKIPGIVAIGLLVGQFLLLNSGNPSEPKCTLNVERPHYSTYLKEYKNVDAIKLNITSECNVPQRGTSLNANIQKIVENKQITAHVFERLTAVPKGKNQSKVIFEDLFVECEKGRTALYSGFAIGQVDLKDGRNVAVRGSSDKFIAVSCLIGAK